MFRILHEMLHIMFHVEHNLGYEVINVSRGTNALHTGLLEEKIGIQFCDPQRVYYYVLLS